VAHIAGDVTAGACISGLSLLRSESRATGCISPSRGCAAVSLTKVRVTDEIGRHRMVRWSVSGFRQPRAWGGPLRSCPPTRAKQAWLSSPPLLRYGGRPTPAATGARDHPCLRRSKAQRRLKDRGGGVPCSAEVKEEPSAKLAWRSA